MKIALYSPYLPNHFGGGEHYLLNVALALAQEHQVYVAINAKNKLDATKLAKIKTQYEQFLAQKLNNITFIETPLGSAANFLKKLFWTKQFDCLYYQTDGSLFFSLAKKNILHIQIPFTQNKNSFIERLKLKNWQVKNTNSFFTKNVVEKSWQTTIDYVHHPIIKLNTPVTNQVFGQKEKIILSVGRFFRHLHSKRQDILVEIFKQMLKLYPKQCQSWKLVLIGNVEDEAYAAEIKKAAQGFPIEIKHQVNREELEHYYLKSAIYWHAAGYEVDENLHPEKVEHFGITSGEAMLAGCLPLLINKGGQREILGDDLKNLLWLGDSDLIQKTLYFMENKKERIAWASKAQEQAKKFNQNNFSHILEKMIN